MTIDDKTGVLALLNANPVFQLATLGSDGAPRLRNMLLYRADGQGIVFHTGSFKTVYQELLAQPRVELCVLDGASNTQVRVSGLCRELDDPVLRDTIIASPGREFLAPMIARWGREAIRVFCLAGGEARCWNFATNGTYPKPVIRLD